jgi:hypothetical protein
MKLTIIELDDWALLYEDEQLVDQNHEISVWDLKRHAGICPFFLEVISGYGTELDYKISQEGDFSYTMKLSNDVMPLLKERPKQ